MARLQKTLVDYVIIAITPALIMVLVGSLVHFLIEIFYGGGYEGRLNYVFSLFVFAAVLIARIAIEEGRERSILFAIPLMIATLLVMGKFVEFRGALAPFSLFINIGLLALVLWCADRLTWDCTVIDEREDASGEGLLQTVGLDRSSEDPPTDPASAARAAAAEHAITQDLEATSSDEAPPEPEYWWDRVWQQFIERRKRPHAPGVWVIYFSLAALPLFGIGQRFIPETDVEARRHAFRLLYYYVGSGLGLLMTTSFLGIRRYLRQRQLDMPLEMTGVWLTIGSIMIVALLLACALLPRPSAEYSITDVDFQVGSPDDLPASRRGMGSEGAEDKREHARNATSSDQEDPDARSGPSESKGSSGGQGAEGEDGGASGQKKSGGQGEGGESGGGSQQESDGGSSGQKKAKQQGGAKSKSKGGAGESGNEPEGGGDNAGESGEGSEGDGDDPEAGGEQSSSKPQNAEDQEQETSSGSKESDNDDGQRTEQRKSRSGASTASSENGQRQDSASAGDSASGSAPRPSFSPSNLVSGLLGGLGHLLKFLYYLFFFLLVAYLVWRYRAQVLEAITNFIQAIRDFWANLFGGGQAKEQADEEAAAVSVAPPRPFADYADPFATATAARYTPQQLLAYSFEALEAWGREHGCARHVEQTPHEYAGHLAMQRSSVGREARNLAELYCFEAFSGAALPRKQVESLRELWNVLRREQASDLAAEPAARA